MKQCFIHRKDGYLKKNLYICTRIMIEKRTRLKELL